MVSHTGIGSVTGLQRVVPYPQIVVRVIGGCGCHVGTLCLELCQCTLIQCDRHYLAHFPLGEYGLHGGITGVLCACAQSGQSGCCY